MPPAERALALRAVALLIAVRLLLILAGFERIRRWVKATRVRRILGAAHANLIHRAVERAGRTVPRSGCLPRALVAARLLREAGLPAEVVIGVAQGTTRDHPLDAHAWVVSDGFTVTGDAGVDRFRVLARFGSGT